MQVTPRHHHDLEHAMRILRHKLSADGRAVETMRHRAFHNSREYAKEKLRGIGYRHAAQRRNFKNQ